MSAYGFGVDALKELIGSLEDIRRFDASIIVNREDVDITDLQTRRPKCDHIYTSELSRHLVLWAWTRRSEHVEFEDERHILETASRLCNQYSDDIPILDRGSSRFKIARLAAAVAARTYSTDEAGEKLIVRRCHVEWVAKWLHATYSKTSHGYLRYSEHRRAEGQLVDRNAVTNLLRKTPSPVLLKTRMLALQRIEIQDVMDWCSYDRDEALDFIAMLVRNNALKREKRWYVKTEALVSLFTTFDATVPKHIRLEDALT